MAQHAMGFGEKVCKALGVDPMRAAGVSFDLFPGEAIAVRVKLLPNLTPEEMDAIAEGIVSVNGRLQVYTSSDQADANPRIRTLIDKEIE